MWAALFFCQTGRRKNSGIDREDDLYLINKEYFRSIK